MFFRCLQRFRAIQLYFIYTVLVSALISSILQALFFPLSLLSRRQWLRLNQWLAYNPLAVIVFCAEVWGRMRLRIFGDHAMMTQLVAGELGDHLMVSLNHVGDIDWLVGFCLLDRADLLGKMRAVAKEVIKFIPGFGWSFYFSDWIFVKRDYSRDLSHITAATRRLVDSPYRFILAILPEGTRFTPEKHQESMSVASKKGLPVFKHHLTPRPRGFHALITCLRMDPRTRYLIDTTILTPEWSTVSAVLSGDEIVCDAMLTFHEIQSVPGEERECAEWLYQLFRDKDEQVEFHRKHGLFPATPCGFSLPRRCAYYASFWLALSLIPPLYLTLCLAAARQYLVLAGCCLGVWVLGKLLDRLEDLTRIRKSSDYGKIKRA